MYIYNEDDLLVILVCRSFAFSDYFRKQRGVCQLSQIPQQWSSVVKKDG